MGVISPRKGSLGQEYMEIEMMLWLNNNLLLSNPEMLFSSQMVIGMITSHCDWLLKSWTGRMTQKTKMKRTSMQKIMKTMELKVGTCWASATVAVKRFIRIVSDWWIQPYCSWNTKAHSRNTSIHSPGVWHPGNFGPRKLVLVLLIIYLK